MRLSHAMTRIFWFVGLWIAGVASLAVIAYAIRVPQGSVERASALCAAIKSAGGGCYVTQA